MKLEARVLVILCAEVLLLDNFVDVELCQRPEVPFRETVWLLKDGRTVVRATVWITVCVMVVESASAVTVTAETPRQEQAEENAAEELQAEA